MVGQRMPRRRHEDLRAVIAALHLEAARMVTGGHRGGGRAQAVASERPGFRSGPGPPCCEAWANCFPPLRQHPLSNENRSECPRVLGKGCTRSCASRTGPSSSPRSVPRLTLRPRERIARAQGHTAGCGREEAGFGPVSFSPFPTARRQLLQGPGTGCLQDSRWRAAGQRGSCKEGRMSVKQRHPS